VWVLGIDVKVQNVLGPQIYGNYFALLNFAYLFSVALDFGLTNFQNRRISQNALLASKTWVETSFLKMILSVIFSSGVIYTAWLIGLQSSEVKLLLSVCVMLFLQSFLQFLRAHISGLQYYSTDVWLSILDKTLMILGLSYILFSTHFTGVLNINLFILVQCMAYLVSIVFCTIFLANRLERIKWAVSGKSIFKTFKLSAPYALLGFLMLVYYKMDAVMIKGLLTDGDLKAGYYAQSYKLLEAGSMFALLFSTLLLPMFSKLLADKNSVVELVKTTSSLLMVPVLILVCAMVFIGKDVLSSLFDNIQSETLSVFPVLFLTLAALSANYIYGTLITAQGNLRFLNTISLIAIVINLVLNFIFLPRIGILGAALATLITQFSVSMCQWVYSLRVFQINYSYRQILSVAMFILSTLMISRFMNETTWHWALKLIAILFVSMGVALLLRLIKPLSIIKVLKSDLD